MLFAGIFDEANRTRSKAIEGIRRFSRAQQEQLRSMNATIANSTAPVPKTRRMRHKSRS